ncbi:hypothetical protein L7F22_024202 [Adiantum nelumboides]|nr:hypothetical protein [Adiantum nelumboides]
MESEEKSGDLLGTVVRPPSIRVSGSFKSSLSGRLTPRSSPSFRRSPSVRTPSGREFRYSAPSPRPWYRKPLLSRRLLPWLVVIALWAYIGLFLQSRWAHTEDQGSLRSQLYADRDAASRLIVEEREQVKHDKVSHSSASDVRHPWPSTRTEKEQHVKEHQPLLAAERSLGFKSLSLERSILPNSNVSSWIFPSIGMVNTTVGTLVGPFPHLEESILGSLTKLSSCSPMSTFGRYVHDQSFMLVFHELSMTGSPLAMFELAKELLGCGGKVVVVALSQKGGLLQGLLSRKIKVLKSKAASTFKAAATVDFIVAGSAVCASWIEQYELENKKGPKRLVWWIMENRKEYFDRSKHVLGLAKALIFLSEAQLQQWLSWGQVEGIVLPHMVRVIPLCVNEELSLRAGLYAKSTSSERALQWLRDMVRAEMGLKPGDVLLTTLGSINPGKGQLKLLQAVNMVIEDFDSSPLAIKVGSKSNKVDYINKMLEFIGEHPRLAESLFWTPVTVHVASLYAASDTYVMNSQGLGETFGRVTVEAMAFALPILGTSAGGTSEIVDNNTSGLLHPVGADGVHALAEHIKTFLGNATLRQDMGLKGKAKVKQSYTKETMYEDIASLFSAS